MNPRLQQQQQQQQALMQQALLQQQQQQQLYHQGILAAAMTQMEPVPSGNLPPGFDPSSCRSVYVGNIHPNVTESLLAEVFQSVGSLEGCKLIRKEKSYGFVDYHDRRSAAMAIATLHGRQLYGQSIKVNWAFPSVQREDTSGHYHIFVGDLCPTITDADLYNCFQEYSSLSDARVMWDNKTGRSKLYGFVSFRGQQDAQSAINEMTGKWLGSRQIRCNWATKSNIEEKQNNENQDSVVLLTNGSSDVSQESSKEEAPENNPAYTTVYVGNLAHEVTQSELHLQFHILGAGIIEEVRVQSGKGFGFVRYQTHEQAALAIQRANGRIACGKSMKCSWGSKPTPPGTASNPLPPPVMPFMNQTGYSVAELLAYQRQLALNQVTAGSITGQQALAAQASALISGGNHAIYESYPGNPSSQQMMYYN